MVEHAKKVELTDDLGKTKGSYAYVEMPTIILFTIPAASFLCFKLESRLCERKKELKYGLSQ